MRRTVKADTICFRCHQKCPLIAEIEGGKIVRVEDASRNRTPPCVEACPLGMDVPAYLTAASRGRFTEAMQIIRQTNPLPHVCGWVCHHPCELECMRKDIDYPVAIREVKRLVTEYSLRTGERVEPAGRSREEEIAIIGSGPAGLTAGHDLVQAGYGVTVYEAAEEPGGMPATVIPDFILPKHALRADVAYIEALGVRIRTGITIGEAFTITQLLDRYQAVLNASGCGKPLSLDIPGARLRGIHAALFFLHEVKRGKWIRMHGRVVVIGGGNTALDAARTALRLGAGEVHLTCLESRRTMPAYEWEVEAVEREGVFIHPALAPQRFLDQGGDHVNGVVFRGVAAVGSRPEGGLTWSLRGGPENETTFQADAVLVAIGQAPSISLPPEDDPRLFVAGDLATGPGSVVESMASARMVAARIMHALTGSERPRRASVGSQPVEAGHREPPGPAPGHTERSISETAHGNTVRSGSQEAARCLNCVTACPKGATIPDVMYHPARLFYPLKREGERGEGRWSRISWDEALDTIAERLGVIKAQHGPEAIAVSCGSGQKHIGVQAMAIAKKLWPTPNTHWGRYTCDTPDDMNNSVTFGDLITYEFGPDYEHSRCMVFWGSNPDVGTPAQTRDVYRALRAGAKMIVIDPRPISMARRADQWLRIRPGTDMALALAMQHVIIREGLYDSDFVEKWCSGFEELKQHVERYSPGEVAPITGLSGEDIVKAARMYATTRPGCIYVRLGAGAQQVTSTQTSRAISLLIALCGNVDVPGGNLLYYRTFHDQLFWLVYDMGKGIKGPAEIEQRRIGAGQYPLMHREAVCDMPGLVRAMAAGDVRALWCVADNLITAEMDSRRIWDIMKEQVAFVFVSDFFMTPTAELADIVLPAAFYSEVDTLSAAYLYPSNTVTASKRVVEPLGECRDDREVAIEIARRMGMDVHPWEDVRAFLNWRLRYLGLTYDEVAERPNSRITFPRRFRRYETSTPPFHTVSGKVELYSKLFEAMGLDPLPVFEEPPESPVRMPETVKDFPLIYVHYRLLTYMHSEGRQIDRQRDLTPHPYLEIQSETASRLGIDEGDRVSLTIPGAAGRKPLHYRARLVPEMHPDVVAGPHGWWFPEEPGPEHGCFDSNINALLRLEPPYDPVVGCVQCRAIPCRVERSVVSRP